MGLPSRLLTWTFYAGLAVFSLFLSAPAVAKEIKSCPLKVVDNGCERREDGRCMMVSHQQRIDFASGHEPDSALIRSEKCQISFGFEHGFRGFSCDGIRVRTVYEPPHSVAIWSSSTGNEGGAAVSRFDSGSRKDITLPKHAQLRKKWLAPDVDQEGWHQTYPLDYAYFVDFYPRRFTKIGPIRIVANDWFEAKQQTLTYRTIKGELRSAVTGQAKLNCLKIYFIAWQYASETPRAEKLMETLLSDIRLEYPKHD